eukprot:4303551-Prymnesium_polylepis.1
MINTSLAYSIAIGSGGAMHVSAGVVLIDSCSIVGSSCGIYGGLLYAHGGRITFRNTNVLNSTATDFGNAIFVLGGRVTVDHSRIAHSSGGISCIAVEYGELHLVSSTVERSDSSDPNRVILSVYHDGRTKLIVVTNTDFRQH